MGKAYTRIWAPRGGWFGANLVNTEVNVGTGSTTVGDSGTTSILLPVPGIITSYAKSEALLVSVNMQIRVAAISASGTVLAQVFRRNNQSTPADVTLTSTLSMEADIASTTDWTYAFAITGTDTQCLFRTTDACRIDIVTTNSVGTQPTATFAATWAVRRVG